MIKTLKFTGNFRDLVPLGFRFQKLYARNYRCYHTYETEAKMSVWIWQRGRDIELEDWQDLAVPILEYARAHPVTPVKKKVGKLRWIDKSLHLLCNRKTLEVRAYRIKEDSLNLKTFMMKQNGASEEEIDAVRDEYYKTYRQINFDPAELFTILDKIEGMYKIIEVEGPIES